MCAYVYLQFFCLKEKNKYVVENFSLRMMKLGKKMILVSGYRSYMETSFV